MNPNITSFMLWFIHTNYCIYEICVFISYVYVNVVWRHFNDYDFRLWVLSSSAFDNHTQCVFAQPCRLLLRINNRWMKLSFTGAWSTIRTLLYIHSQYVYLKCYPIKSLADRKCWSRVKSHSSYLKLIQKEHVPCVWQYSPMPTKRGEIVVFWLKVCMIFYEWLGSLQSQKLWKHIRFVWWDNTMKILSNLANRCTWNYENSKC